MTSKLRFCLRVPKKTIGIIVIIVILGIVAGSTYLSNTFLPEKITRFTEVQTAVAGRGNLVLSASGTGALIAQTEADFGFETSGQVSKIFIKVGDHVEAGQVLAKLDDTLVQMKYVETQQAYLELYSAVSIATVQQEIATAKDDEFAAREWLDYLLSPEVMDAEENLAIAEQRLAEARAQAEADPSDETNQTLAEREDKVAYLKDKLAQAKIFYEDVYLPENFGVYENIGSRRFPKIVPVTYIDPYTGEEVPEINRPSAADIAKARNDYAQAKETIQEGEVYLDVLNTGVIPEGATGEKLSALYNARQALDNAQSALNDTNLIAPISGTVTSLDMNVGEQGGASSVIAISQLSQPYVVDAYLDEADWSNAKIGNKVRVMFDLLPEQTFPGTVTIVYPGLVASGNTSLVHIVVQLDQSISQGLPAGTGAGISVLGGEANDVVLVPVNAVHKKDGRYVVTVIQNDQPVERDVEIGIQNETFAEIKSGVDAGETVVTE